MDFICLQWLATGLLSGRNNGLLRCYVGFSIRAKTGFSYDSRQLGASKKTPRLRGLTQKYYESG